MSTCRLCKVEYVKTGKNQKFCSTDCQTKSRPKRVYDKRKHHEWYLKNRIKQKEKGILVDPNCKVCNNVFKRNSNFRNKKYCSVKCAKIQYRKYRELRKIDPCCIEKKFYSRILKVYGLSKIDYDKMLANQNGACAVCLRHPLKIGSGKKILNIDHNHNTGKVRGLLCLQCNRVIGMFSDDADRFMRASNYLR